MPALLSQLLQQTIERELPNLQAMSDVDACESPRDGWTRKQELGHLIDSATNNHARFVLVTLEDNYKGKSYDQVGWVDVHGYASMQWSSLADFWFRYNTFLSEFIARVPDSRLDTNCEIGNSGPITLRFLIEDYVVHMQHHIDQILGRERVTQYPQVQAASR